MKILELKNITVEIIISVDRLKSTIKETEERISKLQDRTIEITQSKQHRENRLEKKNRNLKTHGTITKDLTFV